MEIKGVIQLPKTDERTEPTSSTSPNKITTKKIPTTKAHKKTILIRNISHHSEGTGQVRRVPLGKRPSKQLKEQILVNRQERIQ